jgi:YHS domain-containing protein
MFAYLARLIVFLIVISVIRSVVGYVQRLWHGSQQPPPPRFVPPRQQSPASPPGTATVLQQDPVCGTYVAIDSSLKRIVGGRVIHFCSPECRDRYLV